MPAPKRARRREVPELDDVDRRLIQLLVADGRATNRALARDVGLTEATVAARIRSLQERRILGVTATFDWKRAGFRMGVWVALQAEGRHLGSVSEAICELPDVHIAVATLGSADLLAHVLAPDIDATVAIIDKLAHLEGARLISADLVLETLKYSVNFARVPVGPAPATFPAPVVPLDELDHAIVGALAQDGRRSNREIGRELQISEGTVRARLKRLIDVGLLRITGQVDPVEAGAVNASAIVGVEISGADGVTVAARLARLDEISAILLTSGRFRLILVVAAPSREQLVKVIVDEIRTVPGIRSTETWDIFRTVKFPDQRMRLLEPGGDLG
jgi:DNA-binding Lrp family transcriptional regulator